VSDKDKEPTNDGQKSIGKEVGNEKGPAEEGCEEGCEWDLGHRS